MQNENEKKEIENVEPTGAAEAEMSVEELGLEVVEDTPQISMTRPVRHIRR